MREIKFRAWDKLEEKFLAWQEIIDFCDFSWIFAETDGVTNFGTNRFIPEQFTGLHDKNGVEIYEGDKLSVISSTIDGEVYSRKTVIKSVLDFDIMRNLSYANELEVIGNIHEKEN